RPGPRAHPWAGSRHFPEALLDVLVVRRRLVHLDNDGPSRTRGMDSELRGADLDHVAGTDTPATNLASAIYEHCRTAGRCDAQAPHGTGSQHSVLRRDPR